MAATPQDVVFCKDGASACIIDGRYFPLIITAWVGQPTMKLAEWYFANRKPFTDQGDRLKTKVIVIADMSNMQAPPATVRKYLGEEGKRDAEIECLHEYIVSVPNALVRGVITALLWISGDRGVGTQYVPSLFDAFKKANESLRALGIQPPTFDGATYKVPEV